MVPMKPSARRFNCARYHCQVFICSRCDRGNLYCGSDCAELARRASQRRAAPRYQNSHRGRRANAARQHRYRARQRRREQKVTHHGSAAIVPNALLLLALIRLTRCREPALLANTTAIRCHVCQCECDPFVRLGFMPTTGSHSTTRTTGRRGCDASLNQGGDEH